MHVNDASRAVTVAGNLLNTATRTGYAKELRSEYDKLREGYLNRSRDKEFLSIADARSNKLKLDWDNFTPTKPNLLGVNTIYPKLAELVHYIDWTPFFQTWDLHGKFPAILNDELVGEQAKALFADAQTMLKQIVVENWFEAKGVYGIFPANQVNDDDVEVCDEKGKVLETFLTLRQQSQKNKRRSKYCIG